MKLKAKNTSHSKKLLVFSIVQAKNFGVSSENNEVRENVCLSYFLVPLKTMRND